MDQVMRRSFADFYRQYPDVCRNFWGIGKDEKFKYFQTLKTCASKNLSWAHNIMHDQAAKLTLSLSGRPYTKSDYTDNIYSNSSRKPIDTCHITESRLYGDKFYASALNISDYSIVYCHSNDSGVVTNVLLTTSALDLDLESFKPIGMENTATGTIRFHGQKIDSSQLLITKNDKEIIWRENFVNMAFPTNAMGLSIGVYNDIKSFVEDHNLTDLNYELKVLGIQLYAYEKVWENCITSMINCEPSSQYFNDSFLLYNTGKRMLTELVHFINRNGTGHFYQINENSQRFRDAMIYTTHMQSYHVSLQEFFRHRENIECGGH